jgi:hypothetical protein
MQAQHAFTSNPSDGYEGMSVRIKSDQNSEGREQKCDFSRRCARDFTRKERKSGGKVRAALYFTVKS